MATKLWEKSVEINKDIERFTVGRDREMDLYLAKYDVLGSMAHITMLESIGLLTNDELQRLLVEMKLIYAEAEQGRFTIEDGVEDVHSQVELMLTRRLGDVGKKIHSGRSRNDQVLLDLKLFTRAQIKDIAATCRGKLVGMSYAKTPQKIISLMKKNKVQTVNIADPVENWKAVKNPVELAGIRRAHLRDGAAMVNVKNMEAKIMKKVFCRN